MTTPNTEPFDLHDFNPIAVRLVAAVDEWHDDEQRADMWATWHANPGRCIEARPDGNGFAFYFKTATTPAGHRLLWVHHSEFLNAGGRMEDLN